MFTGDAHGGLAEVDGYAATAASGSTYLPSATGMELLLSACQQVVRCWIGDLQSGAASVDTLQPQMQAQWRRVLAELSDDQLVEQLITDQSLCMPGAVLERSALLWRNQSGPAETWCAPDVSCTDTSTAALPRLLLLSPALLPPPALLPLLLPSPAPLLF